MTIPTGGPLSPPASPRQHSHHRQRACPIVHPAAPITSKKAEEITDTNDPLAEFYAQAQAEIDEEVSLACVLRGPLSSHFVKKLSRSDEVEESDLSNDEEEEANRRPPRIKRVCPAQLSRPHSSSFPSRSRALPAIIRMLVFKHLRIKILLKRLEHCHSACPF